MTKTFWQDLRNTLFRWVDQLRPGWRFVERTPNPLPPGWRAISDQRQYAGSPPAGVLAAHLAGRAAAISLVVSGYGQRESLMVVEAGESVRSEQL